MVKTRIQELAKMCGITTAYQLQVAAKLPPSTAARLWRDAASSIALNTIDRLCETFKCEPGDLFTHKRPRN